jgi:hypothetical protein
MPIKRIQFTQWAPFYLACNSILAIFAIILENAVESTASGYCTDNLSVFDDFLLHRMGDTPSAKNHQNA